MNIHSTTALQTLGQGSSVLGSCQVRIPVSGKVRAGIKVLTSKAAAKKGADEIYRAGVAAGKPFSEIEKELESKLDLKNPLAPRNVPYFTARPTDFAMPEIADRIVKLYGTDRGEGLHIYRFPVLFPMDSWQACMPHGLKCHTRSELVYWSEYSGDTRFCKTRGKVQVDPRARRAHRSFGGRPVEIRGICSPDECPEYQERKCNLSGSLLFYIPDIPGTGAIELPTTSFYSLDQMRQTMEMVSFLRGGKISGTIDGKPIFYVTKRLEEVAMIDPADGTPKRKKQWLIVLEADVDMGRVIRATEEHQVLLAGTQAALAIEGSSAEPAGEPQAPPESPREQVKTLRRAVQTALEEIGIPPEQFAPYAAKKWGDNWGKDLASLESARDEVTAGANDVAGFRTSIGLEPF